MDLKAYLEISRPHNSFLASLVSLLGSYLAAMQIPELKPALIAAFIVFIETAAGNAINDYFDYEIDKINKPQRPIPSGRITRKEAKTLYLTLITIGILTSLLVNIYLFIMTIIASTALYTYSWKLKGTPLYGNIIVALMTGLVPVYGGVAVLKFGLVYYMGLSAFLVNLAREIIKDIEDMKGDKDKANTLPLKIGEKKSLKIGTILIILTIASTLLPIQSEIGWGYYLIIIPNIILIKTTITSIKALKTEKIIKKSNKIQKNLKIAIPIALIVYLLGAST